MCLLNGMKLIWNTILPLHFLGHWGMIPRSFIPYKPADSARFCGINSELGKNSECIRKNGVRKTDSDRVRFEFKILKSVLPTLFRVRSEFRLTDSVFKNKFRVRFEFRKTDSVLKNKFRVRFEFCKTDSVLENKFRVQSEFFLTDSVLLIIVYLTDFVKQSSCKARPESLIL